jgi:hypothetical protein
MTSDDKNKSSGGQASKDSLLTEKSQDIPLSQQDFASLVDVFLTLRQWDLEQRRKQQKDAQVDNSRTRS